MSGWGHDCAWFCGVCATHCGCFVGEGEGEFDVVTCGVEWYAHPSDEGLA